MIYSFLPRRMPSSRISTTPPDTEVGKVTLPHPFLFRFLYVLTAQGQGTWKDLGCSNPTGTNMSSVTLLAGSAGARLRSSSATAISICKHPRARVLSEAYPHSPDSVPLAATLSPKGFHLWPWGTVGPLAKRIQISDSNFARPRQVTCFIKAVATPGVLCTKTLFWPTA